MGQKVKLDIRHESSHRKVKVEEERNYDLVLRKKRDEGTLIRSILKFMFSHVGLVLLCVALAVGGAFAFIGLEKPHEKARYALKQKSGQSVEDSITYMSSAFWWYIYDPTYNYTESQFLAVADERLGDFISFIITAVKDTNYDGTVDGWTWSWTFPNALLFTLTIMTTIGYGEIYPVTLPGQMFCIGYALVSIALFFIMLANVGSAFARGIIYLYSRCCCRWFRSERLNSEIPSRTLRKKLKRRLIDEEVGDEDYMPTNYISIPNIVNVVILFAYIFLGALLFTNWEGWSFLDAVYFSFITLATIGLGDLVPNNSYTISGKVDFFEVFQIVVATVYIALGLAVLSLCLSLIQEDLSKKAARIMHGKEELVEMDVVVITERRADITVADTIEDPVVMEEEEEPLVEEDIEETPMEEEETGPSRPGSGKSVVPGAVEEKEAGDAAEEPGDGGEDGEQGGEDGEQGGDGGDGEEGDGGGEEE